MSVCVCMFLCKCGFVYVCMCMFVCVFDGRCMGKTRLVYTKAEDTDFDTKLIDLDFLSCQLGELLKFFISQSYHL